MTIEGMVAPALRAWLAGAGDPRSSVTLGAVTFSPSQATRMTAVLPSSRPKVTWLFCRRVRLLPSPELPRRTAGQRDAADALRAPLVAIVRPTIAL